MPYSMSRNELDKIIDNLDTVFRGDAWHGPSVMEISRSMPTLEVDKPHAFSKYTIAQLIYHLTAWREFVIQKLNDNIHFDLQTEEENYGTPEEITAQNWQTLINNLQKKQKTLIETLEQFDDSLLSKTVPGCYYDYYKLLTGLIQHDTYHLGMIWVLWQ